MSLSKLVHIPADSVKLEGMLEVPDGAIGLVLFAHGSGSSRHSPRNNYVATILQKAGIGTLLFDLMTEEEDLVYESRFDIEFLTKRLIAASRWAEEQPEISDLSIGYFGASTGAAAALVAAVEYGPKVAAVVSRGGRVDMAGEKLGEIKVPVLFIVGSKDYGVVELNQQAYEALGSKEKEMSIIPGAAHFFEEPGALDAVAERAADWFKKHFKK